VTADIRPRTRRIHDTEYAHRIADAPRTGQHRDVKIHGLIVGTALPDHHVRVRVREHIAREIVGGLIAVHRAQKRR
jgi:hypothetical protein